MYLVNVMPCLIPLLHEGGLNQIAAKVDRQLSLLPKPSVHTLMNDHRSSIPRALCRLTAVPQTKESSVASFIFNPTHSSPQ